jgi:hypothetical protein
LGVAFVLAVALCGCAGQPANGTAHEGATPATGPPSADAPVSRDDWQAIERLIADQKYQAAVDALAELRRRAETDGASSEWTRALTQEVQLTAALGGVETAVRLLAEARWPDGATAQTVSKLLYGHGLARYLDVYGWEIGQRERVASSDPIDLKRWTRSQIVDAIDEAYGELWAERAEWGAEPLGELAEYLEQNNYPARIRGTLRDVVSYLWVEFLANTAYWEPDENTTVYRLDLEELANGRLPSSGMEEHPLARLADVLGDLERWHREAGRPEAALEALLERLRRLEANVTRDDDRKILRRRLESALHALGSRYAWWSVGQAQLARMVRAEAGPNSLVEARDLARAGREAHPESVGGSRCASLEAELEAPSLALESMQADGPDRRSLLVQHKNIDSIYFRAYALDLEANLIEGEDYNLLPAHRQVEALLTRSEPSHRWRADLPPTPDLRLHRTYVTPPFD